MSRDVNKSTPNRVFILSDKLALKYLKPNNWTSGEHRVNVD